MIKSMTGYGRGAQHNERHLFEIEVKSVNNRYNDFIIKLPKQLKASEEPIKKILKQKIKRGRVEVYVNYSRIGESDISLKLDIDLAKQYFSILSQLKSEFLPESEITLDLLAKYPDVILADKREDDEEELVQLMEKTLDEAIEELVSMRENEGRELFDDLMKRIQYIAGILDDIFSQTQNAHLIYKNKLRERIAVLLDDIVEIDESKLANEVAYYADKSNITEEIVRFRSHIVQFNNIMQEEEPVGRKLDFLIQEMNREVNTIGSKVQDFDITNQVIEIKSELEKIREQVQNIE